MVLRNAVTGCVMMMLISSCANEKIVATVSVKNDLNYDREEVVSVDVDDLKNRIRIGMNAVVKSGNTTAPGQFMDNDADSLADELVFLASVRAGEQVSFKIELSKDEQASPSRSTFSRFVPERTDDYAWENDLVAFRTYGPEAQRMAEAGEKGGTLTSGLDCWLKRVDYPIIDKWYKKYTDGGSYHKDDGEGYDPYHVGKSRGCGGLGVWKDDSLFVSKNFTQYKKIAEGPVRNIFELTYAPWEGGGTIMETKRITIDLGSQLYKIEARLNGTNIPNCTIGITLHDKKGTVSTNPALGTFSYWEPIDDSEIGTGVVISPDKILSHLDFRTPKKDLSHIYIIAKADPVVTYYTGFAWTKAGKIKTAEAWNKYLESFSEKIQSPMTTKLTWD